MEPLHVTMKTAAKLRFVHNPQALLTDTLWQLSNYQCKNGM